MRSIAGRCLRQSRCRRVARISADTTPDVAGIHGARRAPREFPQRGFEGEPRGGMEPRMDANEDGTGARGPARSVCDTVAAGGLRELTLMGGEDVAEINGGAGRRVNFRNGASRDSP